MLAQSVIGLGFCRFNVASVINDVLTKDMQFEIRSHLSEEELLTSSLVCKKWHIINNDNFLWKERLKRVFPKHFPSEKFSYAQQFKFLKNISKIGRFPPNLIKIIGEFYQYKQPLIINVLDVANQPLWSFNVFQFPELKSPITIAIKKRGSPSVIFKLKEKNSKNNEGSEKVIVLMCYPLFGRWKFEHLWNLQEHFVVDENGRILYEKNIDTIEKIVNNTFEKLELTSLPIS